MNNRKSLPLKYPDNFMVSVVITNLDVEAVVQQFIDELSFYDFYGPTIPEGHHYVSGAVLDLIEEHYHRYTPLALPDSRPVSHRYLTRIHALINDTALHNTEKRAHTAELIKEWEKELSPLIHLPQEVMLEQDNCVKISYEFHLICALCHKKPEHALTHFMDEISIARIQAYNQFDPHISYKDRPYVGSTDLPVNKKEIRKVFERKFTALHNRMNKVKSYEERVLAYEAFYKQWSEALILN